MQLLKFNIKIGFILLIILAGTRSIYAQLRINEILAANISANFNTAWNYTDWVEIVNISGSSVNLNGYSITDDPGDPRKFYFWTDIWLDPGNYFIISLDKKDYINSVYVHTNFSLDPDGEFIGIYNSAGNPVDTMSFGKQTADISYGCLPEDENTWVYFKTPTPGGTNNTDYLTTWETAGDVRFSVTPGFYSGSVTVELSADGPADEIVYTTNGDYPKSNASVYSGPITITENTAIRARCRAANLHPGEVSSASYFIDTELPNIPVISISTDDGNFYNWTYGYYCDGNNGVTGWCSEVPVNWYRDWERPLNIEYFTQDGQEHLNQLVGSKIYGGCSRANALRSFSLVSREDYGKKGMDYAFFPDKDIDSYKSLVLRNSGNDVTGSMMRDGFMQTLLIDRMDVDYQAYQPVLVYLNGELFGMMNLREKMNEHYAAANHGVDPDNLDIIEKEQYIVEGDLDAYTEMLEYLRNNPLSNQASYETFTTMFDVSEYMNYFIANIYYENEDWPQNNAKWWRERKEGARWRSFLYDTDFGFDFWPVSGNTLTWALRPHWSTEIFVALMENESFRNEFIQRFAAHINTTWDPDRVLPILDSLKSVIEPHIPGNISKYSVPYSLTSWEWDVNNKMPDFANSQPDRARGWISNYFGISGMYTLNVSVDDAAKGFVRVCEVVAGPDYAGRHFNNVPVRLVAVPRPGFQFSGWTGALTSSDPEVYISGSSTTSVTALFCPAEPISGIIINEFLAGNAQGITDDFGEREDWIELYNTNEFAVDVAGLYLTDSADYLMKYQIPYGAGNETVLEPGGYLVLWADSDPEQGALHLPFKLKKSGETLIISQTIGTGNEILDSLSYQNQYDDCSFGRDAQDLLVWKYLLPTPGAPNEEKILENIYINEFMASNSSVIEDESGEFEDWIELYNDNNFPVDIGGLFLTDSLPDPHKFRIPVSNPDSTTIPAKGFLLLWADNSTEQGIRHLNFKLSGSGEQIGLIQPNGLDILDTLTYPDLIADAPWGRTQDGYGEFTYRLATPEASNVQPDFDGLYINEFMASNQSVLQDPLGRYSDWIEIYNANPFPVDIGGLFLTDKYMNRIQSRIPTSAPEITNIPAGGFILLWADDSTELGPDHLNFRLSGSGEEIGLLTPDALEFIDSVSYERLANDAPYGRITDASPEFAYMLPTPGASNTVTMLENIFINEIMAANTNLIVDEQGEYDDWIELYNANPHPVNIGGLFFTDDLNKRDKCRIPACEPDSTTIPAEGYLLLWADDSTEQGIRHLNFKLSSQGESLALIQPDGHTILDSVSFGLQNPNVSYGREEDGSDQLLLLVPSPLAPNVYMSHEGIIISEIMASDQTGFADEHGEYEDWIELYNSNDFAMDVCGLFITDSLEYKTKYQIPCRPGDSTLIPPGGYLVLWADNQPEQGVLHLDFGLRESGEQVGLFEGNGEVIDTVSYGNQYNNFSYSLINQTSWYVVPPTINAANEVPLVSGIQINEYMAANMNRLADEFGEYDDWLEIYNSNNYPVDLAGLYLTDSLDYPDQYRIPSNNTTATTVPAKGFIIIWADSDSEQGPLHTNFKLSRDNGQIGIFNYDQESSIDVVSYGKQPRNLASGRIEEGNSWLDMPPTPGASNQVPDYSALYINEIMASNAHTILDNHGESDDWIELYNSSTETINVGGIFITDNLAEKMPFRISAEQPDSTTIKPGSFLLLWADDSTEQGVLHTNFKLSSSGEQVVLLGLNATDILDSVSYVEVPVDISYGRTTDGGPQLNELLVPTPLQSNTITAIETNTFITSNFSYKVYPNPANQHTVFRIETDKASDLSVRIYNLSGDLVKTVVEQACDRGIHEFSWNLDTESGSPLSQGVYYFVIETDTINIRDKILIAGN